MLKKYQITLCMMILACTAWGAQDSIPEWPKYLVKVDPAYFIQSRIGGGVEKKFTPKFNLDVELFLHSDYGRRDATGISLVNENNAEFDHATGFGGNICLRHYLNNTPFKGTYISLGLTAQNNSVSFNKASATTGFVEKINISAPNRGFMIKLGYQYIKKFTASFDSYVALGYNSLGYSNIQQDVGNAFNKGFYGRIGFLLNTHLQAKDEAKQMLYKIEETRFAFYTFIFQFFNQGPNGGFWYAPVKHNPGFVAGLNYRHQTNDDFSIFFTQQINYSSQVQACVRKYYRPAFKGFFSEGFLSYTHVSQKTNFNKKTHVNDLFGIGVKYGYTIARYSGFYADLMIENGLNSGTGSIQTDRLIGFYDRGVYMAPVMNIGIKF